MQVFVTSPNIVACFFTVFTFVFSTFTSTVQSLSLKWGNSAIFTEKLDNVAGDHKE